MTQSRILVILVPSVSLGTPPRDSGSGWHFQRDAGNENPILFGCPPPEAGDNHAI
ncbi:MAG: hypothetical protein AAGA75_12570 [Cyanobacteria bacterium P01_E01_bin.6]